MRYIRTWKRSVAFCFSAAVAFARRSGWVLIPARIRHWIKETGGSGEAAYLNDSLL